MKYLFFMWTFFIVKCKFCWPIYYSTFVYGVLRDSFAQYCSQVTHVSHILKTWTKNISSIKFGLVDDVQLLTKGHSPASEAAAFVSLTSMTFEHLHDGTPKRFLLFIFFLPVSFKAVECLYIYTVCFYECDTMFKVSMHFARIDIIVFVL